MTNLCRASTLLALVKICLQQLIRLSTGFLVVKTVFPIFYKPSTGLVVVKLERTILHRHSAGFGVGVKFLYGILTTLPVAKTCLSNT